MDLQAEFAKRGPWVTHFEIDGVQSGGQFDPLQDGRIDQFFEAFPRVRSILELGSLEGGHTLVLAGRPGVERVLGIEARPANIAKGRFVHELLRVRNAEFMQADLETADLAEFGKFSAVFCCGLLYHLRQPWKLIAQIPRVSSRLFIWTHYADDRHADMECAGFRGREYVEGGPDEHRSGLSAKSFWLTLDSLKSALASAGFNSVRILSIDPKGTLGPNVTLVATSAR